MPSDDFVGGGHWWYIMETIRARWLCSTLTASRVLGHLLLSTVIFVRSSFGLQFFAFCAKWHLLWLECHSMKRMWMLATKRELVGSDLRYILTFLYASFLFHSVSSGRSFTKERFAAGYVVVWRRKAKVKNLIITNLKMMLMWCWCGVQSQSVMHYCLCSDSSSLGRELGKKYFPWSGKRKRSEYMSRKQ